MQRELMKDQLQAMPEWDICIIGGGATGLGIAVDAASRGYATVLFEKHDFAKGTSSRSTKLVHGGVRYLQQGNIKLVLDALHERGIFMRNAPHLVKNQSFVIPNYEWWEYPFYGLGLKAYDWMAGSLGLGPSTFLSLDETLKAAPTLDPEGLRGGVLYHDGQFDDSRMAIHLAMTAADHGAVVLNYFNVEGFIKNNGKVGGVRVTDTIAKETFEIKAKVVINATGVFTDSVLQADDAAAESIVTLSQGIHLVFDASFLPSDTAIMIPRTEDGRVLFAVPWHEKLIVGTTDTPVDNASIEPVAMDEEVDFVIEHMRDYLTKEPVYEDIKSVFCGLRPLIKGNQKSTASISREHHISISESGLISIAGGKWTTYRKMAEDVLDVAIQSAHLTPVKSITNDLHIHGYKTEVDFKSPLYYYGSDIDFVEKLMKENTTWADKIDHRLSYLKAEIIWAVRNEMCMTIEDLLARRTRMLFLDAQASIDAAPLVARIMAAEMDKDASWIHQQVEEYKLIAKNYLPSSILTLKPD
ncbi:MAG TPA: glycerol-3-phosphate dehydrogenase/oxidase [Saprospiraceae bacterium]|nr:glycerol-3-phosphate dehydrogenase/oxidase [Saprospiraceae bacterium]